MADVSKVLDKAYEAEDFSEPADAPVDALEGVSEGDAERLRAPIEVRPVRISAKRFRQVALTVTVVAAVAVAGCGSKSSSSSHTAATGTTTAHISHPKTKFVLHAGLAFGAFHHWIYKPAKAGDFRHPFAHNPTRKEEPQ